MTSNWWDGYVKLFTEHKEAPAEAGASPLGGTGPVLPLTEPVEED
jgi:hypothetical protein